MSKEFPVTGSLKLPWDGLRLGGGEKGGEKPPGGEQYVMRELEELGLTWGEAQAKAQDRVYWRSFIATLCPSQDEGLGEWVLGMIKGAIESGPS